MSEVFHWRNTLQTGEYLALGKLSRILDTTIVFYGWFPIEWVYNIAIIAQFRCAPREVKNRHFGFLFLFLFLQDRKNILKMNKEVGMQLPKKELIQVE